MACHRSRRPPSALSRWTILFAVLQGALFLAAVFVTVIDFLWRNLLASPIRETTHFIFIRLAVSSSTLNGGLVFAAAAILSNLVSLWTLVTHPTKDNAQTKPLLAYLAFLALLGLATLVIATIIWFFSLRERRNFTPVWAALATDIKVFLQNDLKCCGWTDATPAGGLTASLQTGFCANPASIPRSPDPNVTLGCINAFTAKMDYILNNIFTTIYGFMAIEFALLLAASTIAQLRLQERRFLRIDYKFLGDKGGFV